MRLGRFDISLSIASIGLLSIGLMSLYSSALADSNMGVFWRYLGMIGVALVLWVFFTIRDYHLFSTSSRWLYLATIALLIITLLNGPTIRGAQRWVGFSQLRFQTAELAKLAIVLGLSKWLNAERGRINTLGILIRTAGFVIVPAALIILQPDLGSALTIIGIWGGMLLVSRARVGVLTAILAAGILAATAAWHYGLHDFQKNRVLVFLNPERDSSGQGYNIRQSVIAIGSGEMFGRGLGRGVQSQLDFLPERRTDFAFAAIAEELGFIGAGLLLLLYSSLLYRTLKIAKQARDDLGAYTALGIWWWWFFQGAVNIGMNLGLLPVTGIPLPFVSYGGSSLIISAIALGILNNISWQSKALRF